MEKSAKTQAQVTQLIIFDSSDNSSHEYDVRRKMFNGKMYFSVVDIIRVLVETPDASDYWSTVKKRVNKEQSVQLPTKCRQLKLTSSDGKKYRTKIGQ